MLHPSYTDLMTVVNSEVEPGEEKVVNSRYSIVLATAKRARQIIDGAEPMVADSQCPKPLSIAVDELYNSKVRILTEEEAEEEERLMEEARLANETMPDTSEEEVPEVTDEAAEETETPENTETVTLEEI